MWYTLLFLHLKYHILVLKVLKSNFYLSIYFFSTLNLSLMSTGIIVEKKMKNLDSFLKWGALSYLSFCTWLWLNFLYMTFGIYILILFVNRKSNHPKCNSILQIVSVNILCKLYGHSLDKTLQIFKYVLVYMHMHKLSIIVWWLLTLFMMEYDHIFADRSS